jgi:hypothetical protein
VPDDLAQDFVVMFIPVPRLPQSPAIDDVANQIEVLTTCAPQEVGKELAPASAGAQMGIGNEYASVDSP